MLKAIISALLPMISALQIFCLASPSRFPPTPKNYLWKEQLSIYPSGPWDMKSRLSLLLLLNPCLETAQILELFWSRPIYSSTWGSGLYSHFHHIVAFISYDCVCACVCLKAKRRREEGEGNARPKARRKGKKKPYAAELRLMDVYMGKCSHVEKTTSETETHKQESRRKSAPPPFKSRNPVHPRLILR